MDRLYVPKPSGGFRVVERTINFGAWLDAARDLTALLGVAAGWRMATFVPPEPPGTALARLHEEFLEFSENPSAGEAADVLLFLDAWAREEGVDLAEAVRAKLRRNVAARFVRGEDGVFQRVKD